MAPACPAVCGDVKEIAGLSPGYNASQTPDIMQNVRLLRRKLLAMTTRVAYAAVCDPACCGINSTPLHSIPIAKCPNQHITLFTNSWFKDKKTYFCKLFYYFSNSGRKRYMCRTVITYKGLVCIVAPAVNINIYKWDVEIAGQALMANLQVARVTVDVVLADATG